jgi:hypothetical protein
LFVGDRDSDLKYLICSIYAWGILTDTQVQEASLIEPIMAFDVVDTLGNGINLLRHDEG